jgi:hypothetical protein
MTTIKITLTVDQARILRDAIDLMHRLRLGQVHEIARVWPFKGTWDENRSRREAVDVACTYIKRVVFPELDGPGHSYGVGSDLGKDVSRMYELYKVLDHALWQTLPNRPPCDGAGDNPYQLRYSGDDKIPFEVVA